MICCWLNPQMQNGEYRGLTMGLERPLILVSAAGPVTSPLQTPRDDYIRQLAKTKVWKNTYKSGNNGISGNKTN